MRTGNLQCTLVNESENTVNLIIGKSLKQRTDLRRATLEILDKILQVTDQMLLIRNEVCRFHLFFRTGAVKFAQVILMILTKTAEILLQFLPPFPYIFQGHLFQMFSCVQSLLNPAESAGRKACGLRIQVFQRNRHALHFQSCFRHHILKLAVFKISDRVCLVGILYRSQILPLDQLVKVCYKLLHSVCDKKRIFMQQGPNCILVQLIVHFLIFQIKSAHDGPVGNIALCGQISCLWYALQQICLQCHLHSPR